jgi:alkyl sulfatase BDS1-like metallo-beta-lactamase superfamily hydrolase
LICALLLAITALVDDIFNEAKKAYRNGDYAKVAKLFKKAVMTERFRTVMI